MGQCLVAPALSISASVSVILSLSQLVKERWSPTQAQKEVNTCLVSDLESVLLAPDWVCCLLGVLSGAKRERSLEQRRRHHLRVCSKPSSFHGADTGPGVVDDVQRYPGCRNSPTAGILGLDRPSFKPQSFPPESQLPPHFLPSPARLVIPALHVLLAVMRSMN